MNTVHMPKVGKREQKIRDKLAKKKIEIIRKEISDWTLKIPDAKQYGMIPKYTSPEEMESIIDAYIIEENQKGEPLTISWLANALWIDSSKVTNREKRDWFGNVIAKYRQALLESYEKKMLKDPKSFNALKYYLENNFASKYSTKTTQDVNISWSISLMQLNREAEKIINAQVVIWEVVE